MSKGVEKSPAVNWRMNPQRYRLEGWRLVAYFDGKQIGNFVSLHKGRLPAEWLSEMELRRQEIIQKARETAAQALLGQLGILIQVVSADNEVMDEHYIYDAA